MAKVVLLEREHELAAISELVRDARAGNGRALVVQGPAGIGKTALLDEGRRLAESDGLGVLFARGGALERDFPYGVVRQLFEPALMGLPSGRRREVLMGAAGLAAPLLAPDAARAMLAGPGDRSFAVLHGLYWLTANLAAHGPLALVIDDLHWSDGATLRFLLYLVRRLEGMSVGLLCAMRTGEPETEHEAVSALVGQPGVAVAQPAPLGKPAVARMLTEASGERPEDRFVVACREATGGIPFLVGELVTALATDRVRPTADKAAVVEELGPSSVADSTLMRLGRVPGPATALAQAVAVLGSQARLDRAARLAGLDETEGVDVVDGLVAVQILRASQPLEFVHPIVRAAIYEDLRPGQRSRAHARAAQLLADEQADIDVVASQLLLTAPAGRGDVVADLRAAAGSAVERGAPESAAVYLQRAIREGAAGRELQAALLYELGSALKLVFDPDAIGRFEEAMRREDDPVRRARIALQLASILAVAGQGEPLPLLDSALAGLPEHDREVALRLGALRAAISAFDPQHVTQFERRLPRLQQAAAGPEAGARELSLVLAAVLAGRGAPPLDVDALVEHGLADGDFVATEGAESWALVDAWCALIAIDEADRALQLAEDVMATARQVGSLLGFFTGLGHRVWAEVRRGNLAGAEADLRFALEGVQEYGLPLPFAAALWYGSDAIIERPPLADVAAMVETLELPPALAGQYIGATVHELRGRVRLLAGRTAEGIEDLRACGRTADALGFCNPSLLSWRSWLGLALAAEDRRAARSLIEAERADAERIGLARGIGVALRSLGLIEGGKSGVAVLEQAVAVLECSPARLEHARALVELGSALRRSNQRGAARERLRAGLDVAHECGATRLAERARTELVSAGAKPRRPRITGRDALTPSEQRIARMAAEGLRNREIAQALFVTAKTVENHLGHVYLKLGIKGREALADALDREQTTP